MGILTIKSQVISIKHSQWSQQQTLRDWSGFCSLLGTDRWQWCPLVRMTRTHDNTGKSVRSHFGVKWHLLELLSQNGQTTQALAYATCAQHNSTRVQTLSGPSNTCWVQSLQRMPWPHTKLLLWLSWTQLNKYTTVTSFTNYWLYNGVKVAMWFAEVTLDKTQQHMLYTYCV